MLQKYEWDSGGYQLYAKEQERRAREIISELELEGHEIILDIGSGDGKITSEISSFVPDGSVLGIDNSEKMICFARAKFPAASFPNLRFEYGDAADLTFNQEFDRVVSFACLHHILNHGPVLKGIRNSVKPGGKIFLQFGGKGNVKEYIAVIEAVSGNLKWRKYFTGFNFPYGFYDPEFYIKWMRRANLDAKRVELVPIDMVFMGWEDFAGWISTNWIPYLSRVPVMLRKEFIAEVADCYLDRHPCDKNGLIHMQMMRLEVEAARISYI